MRYLDGYVKNSGLNFFENEAGEGNLDDDEKKNGVPGFELTFAGGAAMAATRFLRACLNRNC
jgi:hypothetical protein